MTDFVLNLDPDLEDKLRKLAALKTASLDAAEEIAAKARSTAPVDSGSYRDQIDSESTKGGGARVIARSNKSAWIEFGVPGHLSWGKGASPLPATMNIRKAAQSLGYEFKKSHG